MEQKNVSGVAKDDDVARIALIGLPDSPGVAFKIFSLLAQKNINVDIILQSIGRAESKDISFTLSSDNLDLCCQILQENKAKIGFSDIEVSSSISKVSIVGAGMVGNPGVASQMFKALYDASINIHMISTSEIKVSVLIDRQDADRAVLAIHNSFFG